MQSTSPPFRGPAERGSVGAAQDAGSRRAHHIWQGRGRPQHRGGGRSLQTGIDIDHTLTGLWLIGATDGPVTLAPPPVPSDCFPPPGPLPNGPGPPSLQRRSKRDVGPAFLTRPVTNRNTTPVGTVIRPQPPVSRRQWRRERAQPDSLTTDEDVQQWSHDGAMAQSV